MRLLLPVIKRVVFRVAKGPVLDEAAQLAFYAVLALVPFLVVLTSLATVIPEPQTIDWLLRRLRYFVPGDAFDLVSSVIDGLREQHNSTLLTVGVVTAVWSASRAANAMRATLNLSFNVEERRNWLRQQGVAVAVTVICALLLLFSVAAVLIGENVLTHLFQVLGITMGGKTHTWLLFRWPLAFFSVVALAMVAYRVLPDVRPRPRSVFIGAVTATLLFMLISRGFAFYVTRIANYGATYGALTGGVVLLLWAWLTAIAFVVGGEVVAAMPGVREKRRDYFFDRRILEWRRKPSARAPDVSSRPTK